MAELKPIEFQAKNGQLIRLRSPQASDVRAITESMLVILNHSDHLLMKADEFNFTHEQEVATVQKYLDNPNGIMIVPEIERRIIGMMNFSTGTRRRNSHLGDFGLSLLPEFRGQGIGTMMIQTLLVWAKDHPIVEKVMLRVQSKNVAAIRLYMQLGFCEEGRDLKSVKFSNGNYDDTLIMGKFVK